MTRTLESLYRDAGNDATTNAYDAARDVKVTDIAEYLAAQGFDDPVYWAEHAMSSAEEMGRIVGNEVTFEIAARNTPSGRHPLHVTI